MKIQELIQLEKIDTTRKYTYMNGLEKGYQKKKGYCWKIPSHSQNKGVLLNNYEKDCVIAYVENKYVIVVLIKIKGINNFKGFLYTKKFLQDIKGVILLIVFIIVRIY